MPVGASGLAADSLRELTGRPVDLALIDFHLPDGDGLSLCCDLQALPEAPRVVIYSAFAGPRLAVAAAVAGAAAVLPKGEPVDKMFALLRSVAAGGVVSPTAPPELLERWRAGLDAADMPVLGMSMARTPPEEIAAVTGEDLDAVRTRIRRIASSLAPGKGRTS